MIKVALLVRLEAKPGKEAEVEAFLHAGLPLVQQEPATAVWFAIRLGPSTFGIFDAFPDDSGRQAHLAGQVAEHGEGVVADDLPEGFGPAPCYLVKNGFDVATTGHRPAPSRQPMCLFAATVAVRTARPGEK